MLWSNFTICEKYDILETTLHAFAVITTLYLLCGLFGYFTWYDSTISEILLAYSHGYSDNIYIFAARLFVLVTVTFSVPIVHYACRKAFCMLVYGEYRASQE